MKEYNVRLQVLSSNLTSTEKIVMMAILLKVDWKSFEGPVTINQIVNMTNLKKRTVQRSIKKLVTHKWITRTSKHIQRELNTIGHTRVLVDQIKGMTPMTPGDDTDDASGMTPMTPGDDTDDTHTISNNINPITNNKEKPEPHGDNQVDQLARERENEFWIYPSSIEDPELRRRTERHIQRNPQMPYSERQRLLYPQLTKSISCKRRTHEVDKRST